jgi:hypothetical protein
MGVSGTQQTWLGIRERALTLEKTATGLLRAFIAINPRQGHSICMLSCGRDSRTNLYQTEITMEKDELDKPEFNKVLDGIPDDLKGLFGEPLFLEGEDPELYRSLLAAMIEERQPQLATDWIAVHDEVNLLWEEKRFGRVSAGSIRGELLNALKYYLPLVDEELLPMPSKKTALKYFSKNPKERQEVRTHLAQYGITPTELYAKAAQLNSEPLQMFERMIAARAERRRMLRKEAKRNSKRRNNNDGVSKS